MSQPSARPQSTEQPLRKRLVLGWSLFFLLVLVGTGLALWVGRSTPVLLDVMAP
jgi:hypothetical protein